MAPSLALAQTANPADLLGPADPTIKGPPTAYNSAFSAKPTDADDVSWAAANEAMRRLGGHVGHLKEDTDTPAPVHADHGAPGAASAAPSERTEHHGHH